jgi:hypothetical protein
MRSKMEGMNDADRKECCNWKVVCNSGKEWRKVGVELERGTIEGITGSKWAVTAYSN